MASHVLKFCSPIGCLLQKLSSTQTPLMGGEGPDIANGDFGGITPRNVVPSTPHALAGAAAPAALTRRDTCTNVECVRCCPTEQETHCRACIRTLNSMRPGRLRTKSERLACMLQAPHRVPARRPPAVEPWQALLRRCVGPLPGLRCAPPVSCLQDEGVSSGPQLARTCLWQRLEHSCSLLAGGGGAGLTPGRTPLRDQLGLNDPDAATAAENRRAEKVRPVQFSLLLLPGQDQALLSAGLLLRTPRLPGEPCWLSACQSRVSVRRWCAGAAAAAAERAQGGTVGAARALQRVPGHGAGRGRGLLS